jgi:Tol biopolymer transport system component
MSWAPDGRRLAIAVGEGTQQRILVVTPLTRSWTELPGTAGGSNPAWSPDGQWIAFTLQEGQSSGISLVHPDGGGLHAISGGMMGCYDDSPSWSPGGDRLVFTRSDSGGEWRLMMMDDDGDNAVFVFAPLVGGGDLEPDWSPDGSMIVFTRYSSGGPLAPGDFSVWATAANGTSDHSVIPEARMARWLPSTTNRQVIFRSETGRDLRMADVTTGVPASPVAGTAEGLVPAIGPGVAPLANAIQVPLLARD